MKDAREVEKPSRRRFLQTLLSAGGATVAGIAVARAGWLPEQRVVAPSKKADATPPATGYHETDHIRRYYETARM